MLMCTPPARWRLCRQDAQRGFSLIELMIGLAIAAIVVAIALPVYRDSVRKSRRTEAVNAITQVQAAQERWRSNFESYSTVLGGDSTLRPPTGLGLQTATPSGFYALALSDVSASGYTVLARSSGAQASDTACSLMGVRMAGGNLKYGSSSSGIDWDAANPDPNRCWAR
jgi:type IV pilus assembly protein PilE